MKPLCDLCGTRHESYQAHVFASNTASNKVSANASNERVEVAINLGKKVGETNAGEQGFGGDLAPPQQGDLPDAKDRKQRWTRDAYNAYQREYMRKRRGGV